MVNFKENEELKTLNHSCAHLMAQHLYPQAKFWVGPVVAEGFYYDVDLGEDVIRDEDIEKIERFLAERGATAAAGRLEACIEADIRFHVALAEATHNEILYELYRSATIHLQKGFEHIYVDTGYFLASQPTHERLVRDIIARDARKALHTIGIILKEP